MVVLVTGLLSFISTIWPAATAPVARDAPLPLPAVETFPVAVIRGSKVSEQVFVRQRADSWTEQPGVKQ